MKLIGDLNTNKINFIGNQMVYASNFITLIYSKYEKDKDHDAHEFYLDFLDYLHQIFKDKKSVFSLRFKNEKESNENTLMIDAWQTFIKEGESFISRLF